MNAHIRNRATRLQLKQFLPVQDIHSASSLGRMVDLSVTGMMLICKQEIPAGQRFRVEITTPVGYAVPGIQLQAESVWCRVNPNNTAHFGVGFRFGDVSHETLALLEQLMQEPGITH
ncbi:MAG: PilZ domain-containing protein [Moraxellaceae bacterium]